MKKFQSTILLLLLFLVISFNSSSQKSFLNEKDLTNVKVDALTQSQIDQIKAELKKRGLTIEQVESQATAKGMSSGEFTKLVNRINDPVKLSSNTSKSQLLKKTINEDSNNLNTDSINNFKQLTEINKLIYGSELYYSNSFSLNKTIATPINYIIGPNDVIKIVIYGLQEFSSDLTVNKEGFINIENVGVIKVSGLSIEAVTERIKYQMSKTAYPTLKSNQSKISLTIGDIRSIQVTIIGANKSGVYNISALSNIINLISEAGGPNKIGSYREVELYRDGKLFKKIDLYKFLQKGEQSQNIGLRENDLVIIPPFKNRLEINGEVKRTGIFELIGNENFEEILNYTGGFTDQALRSVVKVIRNNDTERSLLDLDKNDFKIFIPKGGEVITIPKILNKFSNRVLISGAVYRPDFYQLKDGMRISNLIKAADGLKEDAFIGRAQLIRNKSNLIKEMFSINIEKVLIKDTSEDLVLKKDDELYINSILDLKDSLTVDIVGEVKFPGRYNYIDSMTLKDLVLMAGGFTYAANKNVEVARLKSFENQVDNNIVASILKTEINYDLSFKNGEHNYILKPYDVISVTQKLGYSSPEIVKVTGQVQNAGFYTLSSRVDRVSDVIVRAGGIINEAYGEGALIKRKRYAIDSLKSDETKTSIELAYTRKFKAKQESDKLAILNNNSSSNELNNNIEKSNKLKDTLNTLFKEINEDYYQIAIDINYILKHPKSEVDLILRNNDEIVIPKLDNRVKISGGVLRPTNIVFRSGLTIRQCISAAGGISEYAKKNRAYVVYANGKSNRIRTFGFFKIHPKIKPGSEIIIPETDSKKDKPITTIIQFTTVLAQVVSALATISLLQK